MCVPEDGDGNLEGLLPAGPFTQIWMNTNRALCGVRSDTSISCYSLDAEQTYPDFGTGYVQVKNSSVMMCALTTDARVRCWKEDVSVSGGSWTEVTVADPENVAAFDFSGLSICTIDDVGKALCRRSFLGIEVLTPPEDERFMDIAVASGRGCGITVEGELWCWYDGEAAEQIPLPMPALTE